MRNWCRVGGVAEANTEKLMWLFDHGCVTEIIVFLTVSLQLSI